MLPGCSSCSLARLHVPWLFSVFMFTGCSPQCSLAVLHVPWLFFMFPGCSSCSLALLHVHWLSFTFPGCSPSSCSLAVLHVPWLFSVFMFPGCSSCSLARLHVPWLFFMFPGCSSCSRFLEAGPGGGLGCGPEQLAATVPSLVFVFVTVDVSHWRGAHRFWPCFVNILEHPEYSGGSPGALYLNNIILYIG